MKNNSQNPMGGVTEKFTLSITESGDFILSDQAKSLKFTAGEALMLLDILKNEETKLRKMAEEASPLPMKIQI